MHCGDNNDTSAADGHAVEFRLNLGSLNRFVRMFDVATNIMTRSRTSIRFVFVLIIAAPASALGEMHLYAVRVLKNHDAEAAVSMLERVYEDSATVLLDHVRRGWLARFPNVDAPEFPAVFAFIVNPDTYGTNHDMITSLARNRYSAQRQHEMMYLVEQVASTQNDLEYVDPDMGELADQDGDADRTRDSLDSSDDEEDPPLSSFGTYANDSASESGDEALYNGTNPLEFFEAVRRLGPQPNRVSVWILAHHHTDRVLFNKSRLNRMYFADQSSLLMSASITWTRSIFRHLINWKLNDIMACYCDNMERDTNTQAGVSVCRYPYRRNLPAAVLAEFARSRVSVDECRSKQGCAIVIAGEWIDSQLLHDSPGQCLLPDARFRCVRTLSSADRIATAQPDSSAAAHPADERWFWQLVQSCGSLRRRAHLQNPAARTGGQLFANLLASVTPASNSAATSGARLFAAMTGSGAQRVATAAQQSAAASAPEQPQLKRHFFRCGDLQYGSTAEIQVEEEMHGRKRITFVSCSAACSTTKNDSNVFLFPNSVPVECALAQAENARLEALRGTTDDSTPQKASAPMFLDWEQHLLIDYALNYLNPTHTIVVNGDPGTGKSTVMYHLFNRFARPACAVPTNKVRHKLTNSWPRDCPTTLRTMTLSACVRRLGNFKCSPRVYSAFVERKLHEAIQRFAVLQHRGLYNVDLIDMSRNKKAVNMRPPDCLFVDECNMCSWRQLGFVAEAARRLDVSVMMFGDSGQNRPIGAPDDNADMISLNSSLIVQLLNNKRLKEMRNEQSTDGLASVLRDNVWNVVSTEDNLETTAAVGSYVRQLLLERLDAPLFDAAEIDLTADVELWLRDIATLDRFYAKNPCARYVRNVYALNALVRLRPRVSMPFLIAQRNTVCDRFNYWYALAFLCAARNAMERSCSHWYARACRRTAYLQFASLNQISPQHATFKTCIDMTGEQLANGEISDDPWCSVLLLCVGMLYHYIGTNPRIPPNCLLRLIAILPDEDDREFACTKRNCPPCRLLLLRRQPPPARKPTVARLLMETVCESGETAKQQFFTVLPEYYVSNRYYSLWTPTPGGHNPREGSRLLGYPLRLAASLTSFKVQGETLDTELYSAVHIDLANMGRQSTLVSLSRLSTSSQLRSILNADQCCP